MDTYSARNSGIWVTQPKPRAHVATWRLTDLDAREVYSIIRDNNLPSQAVARRLGMEPRCTFSKHYYGIDMPHIAFSVRRAQSVIVTPRLLLRNFEPGDAEALYEYLSDPEVVRYEPYEPFSRAMAEFEAHARALKPRPSRGCAAPG